MSHNHHSNDTRMLFEDDVKWKLLKIPPSHLRKFWIGVLSGMLPDHFEGRLQISPKLLMNLLRNLGMDLRNLLNISNSQTMVNEIHLSSPTCLHELIMSKPLLIT